MAVRGLSLPLVPLAQRTGRRLATHRLLFCRAFSSHPRHVAVSCASDSPITISLYHERRHPRWTPLLLYLPPAGAVEPAPLPDFLRRQQLCPVASLQYRWAWPPDRTYETLPADSDAQTDDPRPSRLWPAPLHDVVFGYDWLRRNVRRPVIVYGEHLGAGLAASLALTEAHANKRTAVRGFAAYNGIYNWSVFIDDWIRVRTFHHQQLIVMNAATLNSLEAAPFPLPRLDDLFTCPPDLLDPFASPSLFFLSVGPVLLPSAFDPQIVPNIKPVKPVKPHRICLDYPHRDTKLDIPAALLLHHGADKTEPGTRLPHATTTNNTYASQAAELVGLMRRGVRRMAWEQGGLNLDPTIKADYLHVRALSVGPSDDDGLDSRGQEALLAWIEEQIDCCARLRAEAIARKNAAEEQKPVFERKEYAFEDQEDGTDDDESHRWDY